MIRLRRSMHARSRGPECIFLHICPSCGTEFNATSGQRSLCDSCRDKRSAITRERVAQRARRIGDHTVKLTPMPCPRCGRKVAKGRRMCRECVEVRRNDSSARTARLKRAVEVWSPPQDGGAVGEEFAPIGTMGPLAKDALLRRFRKT